MSDKNPYIMNKFTDEAIEELKGKITKRFETRDLYYDYRRGLAAYEPETAQDRANKLADEIGGLIDRRNALVGNGPVRKEYVLGVRYWDVDPILGALSSASYYGGYWEPGKEAVAHCGSGGGHDAPWPTCTCGLHAYYNVDRKDWGHIRHHYDVTRGDKVRGVVMASGRVVKAKRGFKAEKMMVVAFFRDHETIPVWGGQVDALPAYEALCDAWNVPLIEPVEDLRSVADLLGRGEVMDPPEQDSLAELGMLNDRIATAEKALRVTRPAWPDDGGTEWVWSKGIDWRVGPTDVTITRSIVNVRVV